MLGGNDAKNNVGLDVGYNNTIFITDYIKFVKSIQSSVPLAKIWLMVPGPIYKDNLWGCMNSTVVNHVFPKSIYEIGAKTGIPKENIINLIDYMGGLELSKPELFYDYAHPNTKGYAELARIVY